MTAAWWQDAVVYQVYLRSFADANGDGIGDLAGLRSRLGYLADLGVDAVWLNPCYASPQRDHGYDISDYFAIDPAYGTVADLERLVSESHDRGVRILMDIVANHCSDQHDWFQEALSARPGSQARNRFLFRDGKGPSGSLPPNNWQSVFGGPAWTRITESNGAPGQWYFHAFDSSQPDFNWRNPEVPEYFDRVLRFWYETGVDGFRIDVAHGHVKSAEMADWPGADTGRGGHNYDMWDQPEVHDIYRHWRALGDSYAPNQKYYVGEIWVPTIESLAGYLAKDELHQAFSFDLLVQPWDAFRMRGAIRRALGQAGVTGGPPAWTLSNHDVHRTVTRYGQVQDLSAPVPADMIAAARRVGDADLELGVRRARAAIMLQLALPGTVYLYQGEELGLPEVLDLPDSARQDPIWLRSGGTILGRDGCRVPIPWEHGGRHFAFSSHPDAADPWLPQPDWFAPYAADLQIGDATSTFSLYRDLISRRRTLFSMSDPVVWLETEASDLIAFHRGPGVCVVNFGDSGQTLPSEWQVRVVVGSEPPEYGNGVVVPANSAAWLVSDRVLHGSTTTLTDRVHPDSPTPQLEPTVS